MDKTTTIVKKAHEFRKLGYSVCVDMVKSVVVIKSRKDDLPSLTLNGDDAKLFRDTAVDVWQDLGNIYLHDVYDYFASSYLGLDT